MQFNILRPLREPGKAENLLRPLAVGEGARIRIVLRRSNRRFKISAEFLLAARLVEARADRVKLREAQRIAVITSLVTRTAKAMAGVPGDVRQLSSGAVRRGEVQAL